MKKAYRKPKAMAIDFRYDEQVTAASGGYISGYGDPQQIGRCQQGNENTCMKYWSSDYGNKCSDAAQRVPGIPVAD